jgi:type II secretory pathway pseudopilin PulG
VEIVVVLAVVSVSFGLVASSLSDRPAGDPVAREAERLAAWVRTATLGAADGRGWTLTYDLDSGALRAAPVGVESPDGSAAVEYRLASGVAMRRLQLVGRTVEEFSYGAVDVPVFAGGTCPPHIIVLSARSGESRTLEVNPITGDVVVLEGAVRYSEVQPFAADIPASR